MVEVKDPDEESVEGATEPTSTSGLYPNANARAAFGGWGPLRHRIFGSSEFLKLWLAQVITATGEWVFLLAVAVKAADVGRGTPEGAVALVLLARLGPGFIFGPLAGVFADRWDRRKLMVICDLARAAIVLAFPLVDNVWQLVLLSLALEAFTLLWMPAKEALVPNLVPKDRLPTANTLSVLATYGTFPLAPLVMFTIDALRHGDTAAGFWFDSVTFALSALLVFSIGVSSSAGSSSATSLDAVSLDAGSSDGSDSVGPADQVVVLEPVELVGSGWASATRSVSDALSSMFSDLRDGWRLIFGDRHLRAVNVGLGVGLVGGGMIFPLGTVYATEVLGVANRGYYAMLIGLGVGLGVGVIALLAVSSRVNRPWLFGRCLLLAGAALGAATLVEQLWLVVLMLGFVGASVGVVYILGFTIIQLGASDEMRGRVFAAFYGLARAGVLLATVAAPALAVVFDRGTEAAFDGSVVVFGYQLLVPGVRVTFWLASLVIVFAGLLAVRTVRGASPVGIGDGDELDLR